MVFECVDCDYKTKRKRDYNQHINAVHNKLKPYECELCNYKFSNSGNLQRHNNSIHLKLTPYKCPKCDKKFSENSSLLRHHKIVHNKIKNFECSKCPSKFSENHNLQTHINSVHNKIKNFECSKCPSKFSTNGSLQRHHKMIHTKIKNFKCKLCSYKFSENSTLQRHIKTHENVRGSTGERAIMDVLNSMKVEYKFDQPFEVKDKNLLRWDFRIKTETEPLFIEYDGKQHFDSIPFFGGDIKLKQTKKRDDIKNKFCLENGYLLLRIKYTEFNNIKKLVSDFIIENTSWF